MGIATQSATMRPRCRGEAEEEALGEELADEMGGAGAECEAEGKLLGAGGAAGEERLATFRQAMRKTDMTAPNSSSMRWPVLSIASSRMGRSRAPTALVVWGNSRARAAMMASVSACAAASVTQA